MSSGIFVTGTDTGVGKTAIAAGLLHALGKRGLTTAAMKPVACGCHQTDDGLRNEDALVLMEQMTADHPYSTVNPYAFKAPMAPHIAAGRAGITIDPVRIINTYKTLISGADCVVVEGVGGWQVPVNDHQTMADIVAMMDSGITLVVGIRLGCLNHALLTQTAIEQSGLSLIGWVANRIEPDFADADANVEALSIWLRAPLVGDVPYIKVMQPMRVATYLDTRMIT